MSQSIKPTLAERAVKEILSAWVVACNSAEWLECVAAVNRALAAERRRYRHTLGLLRVGWLERSEGRGGWQDREGALRGVQALDEALRCVRPPRRRK